MSWAEGELTVCCALIDICEHSSGLGDGPLLTQWGLSPRQTLLKLAGAASHHLSPQKTQCAFQINVIYKAAPWFMQMHSILCKCTTDLSLVEAGWQVQALELECSKNEKVSALCNGVFFREQISLVTYSKGYVMEYFVNISWSEISKSLQRKAAWIFQ